MRFKSGGWVALLKQGVVATKIFRFT